jgi:hypothetical protein
LQAGLNFAYNIADDGPLLCSQLERRNKARRCVSRQLTQLMNVQLTCVPILYGDR